MKGTPALVRQSARRSHAAGLWPRITLHALVVILALAGIRSILRGAPAAPRVAAPTVNDLAAEAFAASFVRVYLSWNSGDSEGHARELAPFLPISLGTGQDIVSPGEGSESVRSTSIVQDRTTGSRERTMVVAADTTRGPFYVAVRVGRAQNGFLYLANYPSLVGPPASTTQQAPTSEQDISDPGLETVLRRAVGNYLESQASNLRADLTAEAVVSLPSAHLAVRSIDRLTWSRPGIAAAELTATTDDQTAWTLRYELGVVKRDRWYVTSIAVNPTE